jgi:O-antigen ligase
VAERLDWARWTWPLALACLAAPMGLLAGLNPELAIVSAVGLAFMLIVFADLASGVVLFTLFTFFELLPGIADTAVSFTKLAGLLLAISWLGVLATRADAKGDLFRQEPAIGAVLVLFLAWAGLSFFWAEAPMNAAEATYRFALNAVLFLIVYTAIRTQRDAMRVLAAFVIGAAGAMLYGVATGTDPSPYGEAARLAGENQNANELASTLVAALALSLGLAFVSRRSPALRTAALAAAVISMSGIVLTVSRSGLVALGVAAIAAIIFAGRWRPKVVALSATVAALAVIYFAAFAPSEARERVTTIEGGTGREDIWKVAWRMVEDHPVRGVGAGNFEVTSIHYVLAPGVLRRDDFLVDTQKVAHNAYLGALAELGVVGLALLVALILAVIVCGVKAIRQFERNGDLAMEVMTRAWVVGLLGLLASLFFASDEYKKQLWLLLAMGPTLLAIARATAPRQTDGQA